jgi:hypothetical protein
MSTLIEELVEWGAALRPEDVPERVMDLAASQVLSQLAAIRAGAGHPLGRKLVRAFGAPSQPESRRAAAVLAGLGSWLNLDDTAYAGQRRGAAHGHRRGERVRGARYRRLDARPVPRPDGRAEQPGRRGRRAAALRG